MSRTFPVPFFRFHRPAPVASLCLVALVTAACGQNVRSAFSIDRSTPDEFQVVTRAPLAVPPSFDLVPPTPGAPRPQEGVPQQRGAEILIGERNGRRFLERSSGEITVLSAGEADLLTRAGADLVQPNIRDRLDEEAAQLAAGDQDFIDSILFFGDGDAPDETLDAQAEAERLRLANALGTTPEAVRASEQLGPVIVRRGSSGATAGDPDAASGGDVVSTDPVGRVLDFVFGPLEPGEVQQR